ncbi:UBP-type zinc finger domain-containing protein [Catalinimonas niigatensis]|uniref:UBP-type zinc finger domain-containing protein n=1 Tax=Catalinimonas niigatensis TaxID=1397264 RepID=UPI002665B543|nr:UBP-type zinc finger domain-containing protein [Catalinimonas niigatensis]WPP51085.1 UBP-type zinc finger domain-containing protein [Catalinimonas niigatensis]
MPINPIPCEHFDAKNIKTAQIKGCQECIKTGDRWIHLRVCQTCGGVHCCDSSVNQHATKHFHTSRHPVVVSAERGERWAWCYADDRFMPY